METYYIYHIPAVKIGCTVNYPQRCISQGFTEYELLETHTDIHVASKREIELQERYGYQIDKVLYSHSRNFCPKEKQKLGGRITGSIAVGKGGWLNEHQKNAGQRALKDGSFLKYIEAARIANTGRPHKERQKLTKDQALQIKDLYATGKYTQRQLGEMFGVSQHPIRQIVNNKDKTLR